MNEKRSSRKGAFHLERIYLNIPLQGDIIVSKSSCMNFKILPSFLVLFLTGLGLIHAQVIINEISYNPPESGNDSLEYIELYNAGASAVNLDGWHFTTAIEDTIHGVSIAAGGYYVAAINAAAMQHVFGIFTHQWTIGALNNTGETIRLLDNTGTLVDSVAYKDKDPFPTEADGSGPSLELVDPALDNNLGANWQISGNGTGVIINGFEVFGTPGAENSGGGSGGPAVTINAADLKFTPKDVVVKVGDVIRWVNGDGELHNVNGQQSEYPDNPASIYSGAPDASLWQFDYTATTVGHYDYKCDVHAGLGMVGTVNIYDPLTYTDFDLDVLRITDGVNGDHLFDGVPTRVTGVVHGINFQPTGYSFYVINSDNVGINVFAPAPLSYTVQEGDLITVSGTIDQFNGLLEITPDGIEVISTNQPTVPSQEIDLPSESTEGSHVFIVMETDSIVDTGASGRNLYGKNENGEQVLVRVDADSEAYDVIPEPGSGFYGVDGVGTQFDSSFPYTDGYQVLAFYFFPLPGFPILKADAISMKPNPAQDNLALESELQINEVEIHALDGKLMQTVTLGAGHGNINISALPEGLFIVKAITKEGIWTSKVLVQR